MKPDKEIPMQVIHKEIDLIQDCIKRMANNSFLLKGWMVSLIAVILAILPEKINAFIVILIMLLITISFWYLDAYFLRLERMYRELYEWVLTERIKGNDDFLYDLNPNRFSNKVEDIKSTMFSVTLRHFYSPVFLLIIVCFFYHLIK